MNLKECFDDILPIVNHRKKEPDPKIHSITDKDIEGDGEMIREVKNIQHQIKCTLGARYHLRLKIDIVL